MYMYVYVYIYIYIHICMYLYTIHDLRLLMGSLGRFELRLQVRELDLYTCIITIMRCACTYAYTQMYTCAYGNICTYTQLRLQVRGIYEYVHMWVHVHVGIYVYCLCMLVPLHRYIFINRYICIYWYMCIDRYICI